MQLVAMAAVVTAGSHTLRGGRKGRVARESTSVWCMAACALLFPWRRLLSSEIYSLVYRLMSSASS